MAYLVSFYTKLTLIFNSDLYIKKTVNIKSLINS